MDEYVVMKMMKMIVEVLKSGWKKLMIFWIGLMMRDVELMEMVHLHLHC